MGPVKFAATCLAQGQEVSEDLAKAAIQSYRSTHSPVVKLWSNIEKAAIAAVETGKRYTVNRTTWFVEGEFLFCLLPSGRRLAYHKPEVCYEVPRHFLGGEKRPVLYHWGVDSLTKKWVRSGTYGGRLTENVVQAIARDVMAEAMLRIDRFGGWLIVLAVHDELIAERALFSERTNAEFCRLMAELPPWAEGLPCKVEGWEGTRYRKG